MTSEYNQLTKAKQEFAECFTFEIAVKEYFHNQSGYFDRIIGAIRESASEVLELIKQAK